MRQSLTLRMSLLAGTVLALGTGIVQAQAPVPPAPRAPVAMPATMNSGPTANNDVRRLVMQIKGHEIEIVVRNGVPTYRIDGEWHGKDKWRNAPDGGFIFDGPDAQPLLTLTPQQAIDMGLTQRVDIPRQTASGQAVMIAPRQVRINTQRDTTTNAAGGTVRQETVDVEVRTNKGAVVALGRDADGKSWTVREYQLDGRSMSADAYRITPERVELLDADGKPLDVIELTDLNRIARSQPGNPYAPATASAPMPFPMPTRPRPMLGITMATVPESLAAHLGIEHEAAVLVGSVMPGQAAEEAGMQPQDVLIWIEEDGNSATFETVREVLISKSAGDTVELGIVRAGKPMRLKATLKEGTTGEPAFSASATVSGGMAFPGIDSIVRAFEAERAEIASQIQEHEARLKALTARLGDARGRDAEQLSRQTAEVTKQIVELSLKSAALAKREQERASELITEFALDGRQFFGTPATPTPPQRWTLREDEGTMFIFENPSRQAFPGDQQQFAATLREHSAQRMQGLAERLDHLSGVLEQRLSGIDGAEPGTIERIERLERESAERARQIEQRLDRIERLLEQLASRQR